MKSKVLRLLPIAALLLAASCTDDQYDLSNVNTQSQFKVDGLVVPLNMAPIKLDAIISVDNNSDDIKTDKNGNYYFQKKGEKPFKSEDVKVGVIMIDKPEDISQSFEVTPVTTLGAILEKWEENAPNKTIGDILYSYDSYELRTKIGIDEYTPIFNVAMKNEYGIQISLNAEDIDEDIKRIDKLGFDVPLWLGAHFSDSTIIEKVKLENVNIDLPSGMEIDKCMGTYDQASGMLSYDELYFSNRFEELAHIKGLDYKLMKGSGDELFDAANHTFSYTKQCGISGTAIIKFGDLNPEATLDDIKGILGKTSNCSLFVAFGVIRINKFSGSIDYTFGPIFGDPVNIDNLPEILQQSGTNLQIDNPQIYLDITNPFYDNNITAEADLRIGSEYMSLYHNLVLDKKDNTKVLSPKNEGLLKHDYDWEKFDNLGNLLGGEKIPQQLGITIDNAILKLDNIKDFTLGEPLPGITGNWEFYTQLSLTENSQICYKKTWDDWESDDLDGLTVEKATITFTVKKSVALDAEWITFELTGKNGYLANYQEPFFLGGDDEQEVKIELTGNPSVNSITGGKLTVYLRGKNKPLDKNQWIEVSNLRMTVDGYYDKEF